MRYCFIFIAFVSLLCSCKGTQPVDDADVLVKVKDRTLRRSEIKQQIPRGLSSADSMLLTERLERKWVKAALVYDVALRNLEGEDKAEVDKLVEEYRHSLIRYRYQEQLINVKFTHTWQAAAARWLHACGSVSAAGRLCHGSMHTNRTGFAGADQMSE